MKHKFEIDWEKVEHPKTFNLGKLRMWAIRSIIQQDFDVTCENIADALGLSLRHTMRILKNNELSELREYYRIMNAAEYLKSRGYIITKIDVKD